MLKPLHSNGSVFVVILELRDQFFRHFSVLVQGFFKESFEVGINLHDRFRLSLDISMVGQVHVFGVHLGLLDPLVNVGNVKSEPKNVTVNEAFPKLADFTAIENIFLS